MVEAVIRALITIAVFVLCFFLVVWFLGEIGIVLPATVLHILIVIAVLIAILILYRIVRAAGVGWLP
jgi:hypothetical protein